MVQLGVLPSVRESSGAWTSPTATGLPQALRSHLLPFVQPFLLQTFRVWYIWGAVVPSSTAWACFFPEVNTRLEKALCHGLVASLYNGKCRS